MHANDGLSSKADVYYTPDSKHKVIKAFKTREEIRVICTNKPS